MLDSQLLEPGFVNDSEGVLVVHDASAISEASIDEGGAPGTTDDLRIADFNGRQPAS